MREGLTCSLFLMRYMTQIIRRKEFVMALTIKVFSYFALVVASVLVLSGCASSQSGGSANGYTEISDPFEGTNRAIFSFNEVVDDNIIHPTVRAYRAVMPKELRNGVHNMLNNLKSPVVFANEVLQGDIDGAGLVLFRTIVNTFAGFGGFFDFAGDEGFVHNGEDFGQTLAVWGFDHGPYLVVPIIGPSSTRDYVGYLVDGYADPLRWYLFNIDQEALYYTKVGVGYLDLRDQLMDLMEDLQKSSIDYYAATRSIYYQRREAMVRDQNPDHIGAPAIPDYDDY